MHAGAVVLDIDGVLVDATDPYQRTIIESVDRHYGTTISCDEVQLLKDADGSDNDWELIYAAALPVFVARETGLLIAAFIDEAETRGGGLDAAKATVEILLPEPSVIFDEWDPKALRETFQVLYLGSDLYRNLKDGDPPFGAPGYIHDEPVLLRPETPDALGDHEFGVVTDRPAAGADTVLNRIALDVADNRRFTMDDWEEDKPHPAALVTVAERLGADPAVFVGNTLGDVKMALNADAVDPKRAYYGVSVFSSGLVGNDGRQKFSEIGATTVVGDVNEVPDLLG